MRIGGELALVGRWQREVYCGVEGTHLMVTIELTETVAVPRSELWRAVSDVMRQRAFVAYQISDAKPLNECDLGPDFRWKEHGVLLGRRYECECHIFDWDPPEFLCFGTRSLFHVSYELREEGPGTVVDYRCELPQTPDSRRDVFAQVCRQSLQNLRLMVEGTQAQTRT